MKIGLLDLDRTGFPNLALMKLSAWHKAQGHAVELIRGLPERLITTVLQLDHVYASAVFTWNREKAALLAALGATVGGSGVDLTNKLPPDIEAMRPDYSLYGIDYGMGYLMRGCIWTQETCPACIVPLKEGKPREVATIDDLLNHDSPRQRPFVVLLDNEFFWKEKWAIAHMQAFTTRGIDWCPSQGLDIRVVTPAIAETLAASPFWNVHRSRRQITFAFDDMRTERLYRRGVELLFKAGIKGWQLQSFVLVGKNSTIEQDFARIAIIQSYGIDPFVMVYRDEHSGQAIANRQLRTMARWVNGRACRTHSFEKFCQWENDRRAA
jgi:hypothetical protein